MQLVEGTGATPPSASDIRRRKAAIIVQIALSKGQRLPLERLPESSQIALTREISRLRMVDRETLEQVAEEFSGLLSQVALSAPPNMDAVLEMLDGHISPTAAAVLREENARLSGADPWPRVLVLSAEELRPIMETESTEVCAVVLSKLPVSKAAKLLGLLPGERARRITYAVSRTQSVTPAAVHRIGSALAETYGRAAPTAFPEKAGRRLGEILNSSQAATRDEVLESLEQEDPQFAEEVRKAIFTFADLPNRIHKEDVAKIIRVVDGVDLTAALSSAMAAGGDEQLAADYVLDHISQRMASQLRDEIEERGRVKNSVAEAAKSRMIAAIREAADSGEFSLLSDDDEED
ncbi:FliG C-terminal domain-containing protein [Roseisalinus antarcticus]|uniref:Flagellar motor switch protein FliG n=1 Tax=Roseisalinus antarcticus TaxID=254357 RepID=A0A1Y5T4C5_9RHOB|nr:FliG C-terminal domain-containing protein [Roseisalinus antarcticus]SLN54942.1 Flagellar motor switch protein FliG [Roseisalinus antarcticus]